MIRYIASRLMQMLPVLFLVSVAVFSMTLLLPGDPTLSMLGENASLADRVALRERLGLDLPLPVQYLRWAQNVVEGDFGRSLRNGEPVSEMLLQRVPATTQLAIMAIILAILIGVPCGIIAALNRNSFGDVAATSVGMFAMAMPSFWLAMLLVMMFSIHLRWLPPSGYVPFLRDPMDSLRLMLLPAVTLGTILAGLILRQTRTSMLSVLSADYVRTARAKGMSERRTILRHALRNALIPIVTVVGLQMGALLGGAAITESIFSIPGLGQMVVDGIFNRDFPAVQGAILVIVTSILFLNLVIDIAYSWIDKRVLR
ncbi:ABC transporter permease [Chelatococcus asaccharovorans]|uniref:Peptide/nickel transport system permease protein n=1 Tax=Chelatococcus asaccharovorans TaxID=28210 RepID=A0A2V3UEX2_9HYPH|nr:ABC transporter permease [Chelatococcus asaccharovorans]MBS7707430.1 ABC transporter permease [Chelatococcus asaccharovorans]PXW63610.1 peptide/nickel transport system permease protein [Chelatococcus asaccharovorans]CAH1650165.1 dipeptide ABC transporter membrane subunit DppB [Chelatococcus asaccharovorans]CAH1692087.1 dipeptide ABC transporter membrane subunit DppB [Chelatococcus asaccharovorans]